MSLDELKKEFSYYFGGYEIPRLQSLEEGGTWLVSDHFVAKHSFYETGDIIICAFPRQGGDLQEVARIKENEESASAVLKSLEKRVKDWEFDHLAFVRSVIPAKVEGDLFLRSCQIYDDVKRISEVP